MPEDNLSSKYFEGKLCIKCGSLIRFISDKSCVNCKRKYGHINQEKYQERSRKWRKENPERHKKQNQIWNQANPEKHRNCARKANQKWYQANPEKAHERTLKWRRNNYERYLEINRTGGVKNYAKRKQAEGSHTTQEWIDLKEQYGNRCLRCGRHQLELDRTLEQDHIVPLTKNGTNWITNIQPLCHDCNGMGGKGTKIIDYR